MNVGTDEAAVLARIEAWATRFEPVRAVVLTSSRARAGGPVDVLSDYDIILVSDDPDALAAEPEWITGVGTPLLVVRDSEADAGFVAHHVMVLYDDGAKIDFSLWSVAVLDHARASGGLPDELDLGYRVLLDKDGRTRDLPPPTYRAYLTTPPTAQEYQRLIEEFWFCATYVAKYLWRQELMPAKVILDYEMTYLITRRLLNWRIGIDHNWTVRPGFFGRGLQRHLDPATWDELMATFAGAEPAAIGTALDRAIALFRRVAISVGADLGYAYPHDLEVTMRSYLEQIKSLE